MGSRLKRARRNWPNHLFAREKSGVTYYAYRDPNTRKETGLGTNLDAAIEAVLLVNRKRTENPITTLLSRIEEPSRSWGQHLHWYRDKVLPTKKLADSTRYLWTMSLRVFEESFGADRDIASMDRQLIAKFLGDCKPRMSNVYRGQLQILFKYAIAEGLRQDNPVEKTIKRDETVQRTRLSKVDFDKIYKKAEPWMQRAMDLALWSLQRRDDVANMRIDHWKNGQLSVRQKKVARHGNGLLRITPGKELMAAIIACLNSKDRGDCPYLVHRLMDKKIKTADRKHHKQVFGEMLTREFAELRDELPKFQKMPAAQRPSWHEIRALGGDLYVKAGWPEQQVQDLLGHSNKSVSAMTKHYLDGHGERWLDVQSA